MSHSSHHVKPVPMKHFWDVLETEILTTDVQLTYLQQLQDAIVSIQTKIAEKCFQPLLNQYHEELRRKWCNCTLATCN